MAENTNYTLTVSGLPTPSHPLTSAEASMVVSVALSTAGGLSHSYASHFNGEMPAYSVKAGMTMLTTDAATYTVNRGTYSLTPVKVSP